jgi:hypothetical protein
MALDNVILTSYSLVWTVELFRDGAHGLRGRSGGAARRDAAARRESGCAGTAGVPKAAGKEDMTGLRKRLYDGEVVRVVFVRHPGGVLD